MIYLLEGITCYNDIGHNRQAPEYQISFKTKD